MTARTPDGDEIVRTRRVTGGYATDLDRVERLNALSRDICDERPAPEEIRERLDGIEHPKSEKAWISYTGAILSAGSFAVFFGGTPSDLPATAILACLITWMDRRGIYKRTNQLLFYFVCSMLTGFLGCLLVRFGIGVNLDKILIGCIMLTMPGIPITYACGICCSARASRGFSVHRVAAYRRRVSRAGSCSRRLSRGGYSDDRQYHSDRRGGARRARILCCFRNP